MVELICKNRDFYLLTFAKKLHHKCFTMFRKHAALLSLKKKETNDLVQFYIIYIIL